MRVLVQIQLSKNTITFGKRSLIEGIKADFRVLHDTTDKIISLLVDDDGPWWETNSL